MSAKPDDTWAIELLDGLLPELNRRTDEANERIRLFELYLRENGLAIPVMVTAALIDEADVPDTVLFLLKHNRFWYPEG